MSIALDLRRPQSLLSPLYAPLRGLGALRLPGLGWLPGAWRQRGTWHIVGRFVLFGPLIGGLPYAWLVFTVPFIYLFGAVPAFIAGLLFATWMHAGRAPLGPVQGGRIGRPPGAAWRAAMGALSALGAAALTPVLWAGAFGEPSRTVAAVIAAHGVPAAVLLALLSKPSDQKDQK